MWRILLASSAVVLWLSLTKSQAVTADPLSQVRQTYVGRRVMVNVSTVPCWHHPGQITAIDQMSAPVLTRSAPNALGERVPASSSAGEVTVSVLCSDGTTSKASLLISVLGIAFTVLPDTTVTVALLDTSRKSLNNLVGTTIYPRQTESLYSVTSSLKQLEMGEKKYITTEPLEPLRVEAIKVWSSDSGNFGLMKLISSGDAREMFAVFQIKDGVPINRTIAEKFYLTLPSCWVKGREKGLVDMGDASKALVCQWGTPDKTNIYGAEEQWIYRNADGTTDLVYIKDDKVIYMQHIDK